MNHPNGIDGLQGREPVAAAVTIGIKSSRGFPTEKDRFHIVSPRDVDGIRPHAPQFAFFNTAAPDQRKVLRANILHRTVSQCFEHRLTMQAFPKGYAAPRAHPNMRPVCEGDGKMAVRWMQDDDGNDFANIKCPNRLCEFRQTEPASCKPFMRILFRLRWAKEGLPTPLVKLTSRSWETTANFIGLFDMLDTAARELGIQDPTLYGFPFTLALIERTKAARKARYPVIVVSPDQDPVDFFLAQRERLAALPDPTPAALPDLQENAVVYEDIQSVEVPGK